MNDQIMGGGYENILNKFKMFLYEFYVCPSHPKSSVMSNLTISMLHYHITITVRGLRRAELRQMQKPAHAPVVLQPGQQRQQQQLSASRV